MTAPLRAHDAARLEVIDLQAIQSGMINLVGGKAEGLGVMIRSGEKIPGGFCITTAAFDSGKIPEREVLDAYRALGAGQVAVRSSATAEDLPDASFAGQQETYLNVSGEAELLAAVERCWKSLDNDRATAYREHLGIERDSVSMAVVVQRMIDPAVAGVMFTANPITGNRTETVIDAVKGLGDKVVDGSVNVDHYVLPDDATSGPDDGCLIIEQRLRLRDLGRRLEHAAGQPQDIEWAIDTDGEIWLLQSRPITTLFPVPEDGDGTMRAFLEVGHMQGLLRPITPMGMSIMIAGTASWFRDYGIEVEPGNLGIFRNIAGRMFIDLTPFLHDRRIRRRLPDGMKVYGPGVTASVRRLLDDPRFAHRTDQKSPMGTMIKVMLRTMPSLMGGALRALLMPRITRIRAMRKIAVVGKHRGPERAEPQERLDWALQGQDIVLNKSMMGLLPPLYAGLMSPVLAAGLLGKVARPGELDAIKRGMPHNVTTAMDLRLWSVAVAAREHRALLLDVEPSELARRYLDGSLPEFGLTDFLREYGHRGAAEIDVGVPRWAEDPTPVFAALIGYLKIADPEHAPDRRFDRAAEEAELILDQLVGRASRTRPVRAALAGFLLRRSRELAGLRELPKFVWLLPLNEIRRQLLLVGEELVRRGALVRAEDIMFLEVAEAEAASRGESVTELVRQRRATHQREQRRAHVPGLLLSDGTMPELDPDDEELPEGALRGLGAAPGHVTGTARVVHDPATARLEPGDILVAATTDPGWTPLFMTAGGLVTERGSTIAHGPTVAREYGIPAVICVNGATTKIKSGQTLVVDGAAGTVQVLDDATEQ